MAITAKRYIPCFKIVLSRFPVATSSIFLEIRANNTKVEESIAASTEITPTSGRCFFVLAGQRYLEEGVAASAVKE